MRFFDRKLCILILLGVFYSCKDAVGKFEESFAERVLVDSIDFSSEPGQGIVVPLDLGTGKVDFIFDTGAFKTHVDRSIKEGAVLPGKTSQITDIFGNSHKATVKRIDSLRLGKINFKNVEVLSNDYFPSLLGHNILSSFSWKIDFRKLKIFVSDIPNRYSDLPAPIPFKVIGHQIIIAGEINNVKVNILLDTGNIPGFIDINKRLKSRIEAAGTGNDMISWSEQVEIEYPGPGRIKEESFAYMTGDLELGDQAFDKELLTFRDFNHDVIVGLGFLKRFGYIVIDYPNQVLYLGDPGYRSDSYRNTLNTRLNSVGVMLKRDAAGFPIIIGLSSNAKKQGLLLKDTIVAIAGKELPSDSNNVFYKNQVREQEVTIFRNGIEKDTVIAEEIPSEFEILNQQLMFSRDSILLSVKNGMHQKSVRLQPARTAAELPDTIESAVSLHHNQFFMQYYSPLSPQKLNRNPYYLYTRKQ